MRLIARGAMLAAMRHLLAPLLFLATAAAPGQGDERDYMVNGFDRLRVDGPFTVDVVTGPPGATADGAPLALDRLSIRVEGSTLIIGNGASRWNLAPGERAGGVHVRVSTPSLRGVLTNGGASVQVAEMLATRVDLGLNGGGTIRVASIRADDTNVSLTGTGAITLGGTTQRARVRAYGAGSVDARALSANEATLISETSGELRMAVRYTAKVTALGTGTVHVDGTPECKMSGSGPIECGAAGTP